MPAPVKWSVADFELVNAENPEGHPWLSASPDGQFSLLFFENLPGPPGHTDIEERIYSAAGGSPVSIGTTFSSGTIEHQPASAYMADGRRIIVWTEAPTAGGGNSEDVYAAIYYGNNVIALPRFLVSGGAGTQLDPVVAASDSGFVIALNDGSVAGGRLVLKFYNIAGTLINTVNAPDAPEGVNQTAGGEHRDVEITALANGNYVVTWSDNGQFDIFARVFSAGGIALSGIIDVEPGGAQATFPDVTALAGGGFVVTYGQFAINTVRGHVYEADGTAAGTPFTIAGNAINALQQQVQSAALLDGRFVTIWVTTAGNIAGQMMNADGTLDGAAFAVNSDLAGDKGRPSIVTLADGRFVVSWESGVGAVKTIFSTIFDPRETGLDGSASSFSDDWYGTVFNDRIYLGTGNDSFSGGNGDDLIFGESGNDTLSGENNNDTIFGATGNDTVTGGLGDDFLHGGDGNDVLNGGSGADTMNGGNNNDTLSGGDQGDNLVGLAGVDTMNGDAGNDTLSGGEGGDFLFGGANADQVIGGNGDDFLDGGVGNDMLTGGGGSDIFFFSDGHQQDAVQGFTNDADTLQLDDALWAGVLTVAQVIANFATQTSAGIVTFNFGGGDILTVINGAGITTAQLQNDVTIV